MTMKTRKPAKAATPKATPEQGPDFDLATAGIAKLIARLRWLEADCRYKADLSDEGYLKRVSLAMRHKDERAQIMQKLRSIVPGNFDDVKALLGVARLQTTLTKQALSTADVAILKNVNAGIFKASHQMMVEIAVRQMREFDEIRTILGGHA